ncbi:hypothetical protein EUTSA_v10016013mg [Eutrema salsugineum]|uniref:Knottin scorpion toxin-like domain-containing protein n=1 Tax=Eutrema salsugineum TaxID=72664 RepID=V4LHQ0_EUTSA|nr:hypothetical protein EUTSA_v10016013mg [Eutrema salsugineum]
MVFTMKTLVAFVITVFFIISSVHCYTTTVSTPEIGYGIKQMDIQCFYGTETCHRGMGNCTPFCRDHGYYIGVCTFDSCCCRIPYKHASGPR